MQVAKTREDGNAEVPTMAVQLQQGGLNEIRTLRPPFGWAVTWLLRSGQASLAFSPFGFLFSTRNYNFFQVMGLPGHRLRGLCVRP